MSKKKNLHSFVLQVYRSCFIAHQPFVSHHPRFSSTRRRFEAKCQYRVKDKPRVGMCKEQWTASLDIIFHPTAK